MARFLQLSDLHVVAEGARASGVLDTRAILSSSIDQLLGMRPALDPLDGLLVSGDVSDEGSPNSYEFARHQLDRLGLPIFVVPGNHDAREPLRAAFADVAGMSSSGLIDWAEQVADTLIVGLDTLVEGQGAGRLRPESLSFLREITTATKATAVVVMLHHPPIQTGIHFMDVLGLTNAQELEDALFQAHPNVTVLAGHVHGAHHGRLGGHAVMTAPSICSAFAMDRRKDAPAGFLTEPRGFAVFDSAPGGIWSALSLGQANGPYSF